MSVRSSQSVTVLFATQRFDTGAATNADSTPTGTLYVNGTSDAASVTVTNVTTGLYKAAVTLPTLAFGDVVELKIAATVNSVSGVAVIWRDTKDVAVDTSGIVQGDLQTIKTQAVTCSGGVTVPAATLASTTNITAATGIDVTKWNGATVASPNTAGVPLVDVGRINNVATTSVTTVSAYIGNSSAVINGTNVNTLAGHDPGATLGTSTLTQSQVTGGAYSLQTDGSGYIKISSGTGTGQVSVSSGVVASNLSQVLATAVTETSAGYLAAGVTKFFDVATPISTVASVNQTGDNYSLIGSTGSGLTSLAQSSSWTAGLATSLATLASHDPGTTIGTSTLTQTQVTGGAYSLQTDGSGYIKVSSGTGTGQISLTSGKPAVTLASTDVTGNVATDLQTIKTQTVTCSAGVTVSPYVGSTGAAINGSNVNTLAGHDPGGTLASTTNITAATGIDVTKWAGTTVASANTAGVPVVDTRQIIRHGTCQATGNNSINVKLDSGASAVTDFYKFCRINFISGTGAGQTALIVAYNGTTKVATIQQAISTAADATTVFQIVSAIVDVEGWHGEGISQPNVAGVPLVDTVRIYGVSASSVVAVGAYIGSSGAAVNGTLVNTLAGHDPGTTLSSFDSGTDQVTVATNNDKTGYSISGTLTTLDATVASLASSHGAGSWETATGFSTHSATDVWSVVTRTLTGATNITSDGSAINVTSGVVDRVTLVDTTTTNTDMVDISLLALESSVQTAITDIGSLNDISSADVTAAVPTVAQISDGVWDELQSGHTISGSFGKYLDAQVSLISGGGGGGDATAANQTTIINHLVDIKGTSFDTSTDSLRAIRLDGDSNWVTATGFSTLDAAGVRAAVGLGAANLDTQLNSVYTVAGQAYSEAANANLIVGNGTYGNAALYTSIGSPQQVGTKYAVTLTSTDVTGNLPVDIQTIKTQTVTCAAGVTVSSYVGSTGAAINGTTVNTLAGHDPGVTLGTSTLTSSDIRTAVGLATANLDSQLADINTAVVTDLPASLATVATVTTKLDDTLQLSTGHYQFTSFALAQAPTGGDVTIAAADVWAYPERTLTMSARIVLDTMSNSSISVFRGDTIDFTLNDLGDITDVDEIWFTIKPNSGSVTDEQAILQLTLTGGAVVISEDVPDDSTDGAITVTDAVLGSVRIYVKPALSALLRVSSMYSCDLQVHRSGGEVQTLHWSPFEVLRDISESS